MNERRDPHSPALTPPPTTPALVRRAALAVALTALSPLACGSTTSSVDAAGTDITVTADTPDAVAADRIVPMPPPQDSGIIPPMPPPRDSGIITPMPPPMPPPQDSGIITPMPPPMPPPVDSGFIPPMPPPRDSGFIPPMPPPRDSGFIPPMPHPPEDGGF